MTCHSSLFQQYGRLAYFAVSLLCEASNAQTDPGQVAGLLVQGRRLEQGPERFLSFQEIIKRPPSFKWSMIGGPQACVVCPLSLLYHEIGIRSFAR